MGRRELRTGDLIVVRQDCKSIPMYAESNNLDNIVGCFVFGIYMGRVSLTNRHDKRQKRSRSFVLDSASGVFGWLHSKWVGKLR